MVLQNFIVLENGVPAVLHFTEHRIHDRDILDSLTAEEKTIRVLDFDVDMLNFEKVRATFGVTSEKLSQQFRPFLEEKRYRDFNFIVTKSGSGFRTEYELQLVPLAPP